MMMKVVMLTVELRTAYHSLHKRGGLQSNKLRAISHSAAGKPLLDVLQCPD